jgi:predicted DNA binding CopG/RHH family protein
MQIQMKTIKNRNINGRPAKKPSEKKAYKITIKMATEEYYSLKAKARLAGVNRSEFIRQCIRFAEVKQRLTPELMKYIRQLSGMANNVNQIARTANAAGYLEVHNHCLIMSERLDNVIQRIEDDC